jgi:hypothetical protein
MVFFLRNKKNSEKNTTTEAEASNDQKKDVNDSDSMHASDDDGDADRDEEQPLPGDPPVKEEQDGDDDSKKEGRENEEQELEQDDVSVPPPPPPSSGSLVMAVIANSIFVVACCLYVSYVGTIFGQFQWYKGVPASIYYADDDITWWNYYDESGKIPPTLNENVTDDNAWYEWYNSTFLEGEKTLGFLFQTNGDKETTWGTYNEPGFVFAAATRPLLWKKLIESSTPPLAFSYAIHGTVLLSILWICFEGIVGILYVDDTHSRIFLHGIYHGIVVWYGIVNDGAGQ